MRSCVRVAVLGTALGLASGCANSTVTTQVPKPVQALPPGALAALVVQPDEAPAGLLPLLRQTGPADVTRIASFSTNPATARRALLAHGFVQAYVVEYAEVSAGTSLAITVSQYATAAGADADLTADLAAALGPGAHRLALPTVGAHSQVVEQPLPGGGAQAELVSVRFRVGRLTYLVASGAPSSVDPQSVLALAQQLAMRAAASFESGPSGGAGS